jgi:GDP-mannose 6-dehydrogenase
MRISVFGLGYVGTVTAGCLASHGHSIVGVDVQEPKVEAFNQGVPPIVEPGIAELLASARKAGNLRATRDCAEAIAETDLTILCVGTPSSLSGALDLRYVRQVVGEIAEALRARPKAHRLVLRSTMLPGSTRQLVAEFLEGLIGESGLTVYYYPEFLREGSAVEDFESPSLAVVGTVDGGPPPALLGSEVFGVKASVVRWETAEMVKYACNAFHATKIVFANEMGRVSKQCGIDARAVMEMVCRDTRLNISPYYLKPGNPFGGSCLPKDVRALTQHGRGEGLQLPLLENLLASNERHQQSLLALIAESGLTEVVILGLAFKSSTDDLRESAMVEVAQTLLGRGYRLRIYDPALNLAALVGSNRRLIDVKMPHLAEHLHADLAKAVGEQGLVVAAQRCASFAELTEVISSRHRILDVNGWPELRTLPSSYEGFCW